MPKIIENLRENLILEGRKTLIEKNYSELNIRDIAKSCGVAIGTFYNYFSNKEIFVTEIFMDDWRNTLQLTEGLRNTNESFKEKIRQIYLSMQSFVDKYISIFYEIAMMKGYDSKNAYNIEDLIERIELLIAEEIRKGTLSTTLSTDKLTHFVISNLMYLIKNKYMSFDELFDHLKL